MGKECTWGWGSHWQSINAEVASLVFCLLASMEGSTVCFEIPLPPPPLSETSTWRPPPS